MLLLLCFGTAELAAQREGSPASAAALLRQTRAYLQAGNLERARASAEAAAAQNPGSGEAQYLLGLVHERRNDLTSAAAAYAAAIRLAPAVAEAHDRLGFVFGSQGRTADALAEFVEAVRLDPRLFDAQYHLGATRWWTRDLAGALPALTAAVALQPGHAEARYYLGITLEGLGRLEPATAELRTGVPTLVVNGDRDAFGVPEPDASVEVVVRPRETHALSRDPVEIGLIAAEWLESRLNLRP